MDISSEDDDEGEDSLISDINVLDSAEKEEEQEQEDKDNNIFDSEIENKSNKNENTDEEIGSPYKKSETRSKMNGYPVRKNAGSSINRIEMSFKGKTYNEKKRVQ